MTHYDVKISAQAEADLRSIFSYIAYELQSVQTASRQLKRLEDDILSLDQMPDRYRQYAKEPWHSRGLRIMPVDNYLVFYIPDHHMQTVTIVRVLYGGRNIDAQLQKYTNN